MPPSTLRIRQLILLLLFALWPLLKSAAASVQPNFVFFITDDISAEDIRPYGNRRIQTPNLDRMAAEALVFDRAYLVTSSCSPSRCSIITGRYPHNHGAPELHIKLPETQKTFTQVLRDAGYHTILSGKNHMGEPRQLGFAAASNGGGPGGADDWIKHLKNRPNDRPFFAWFASTDAHRDWSISKNIPAPDPLNVDVPPYLFDGPKTREDLANYYHEIQRTDAKLGEIMDELDAQGISGETYLIYCSDNGRPFPRCKTRLYECGVRTPFLVRRIGHVAAGRSRSTISSIDIAPTVLDLAGLKPMPTAQGVSFSSVLRDPSASVRDYAFSEHNWHVYSAHERSVRFGDWLYIRNAWPERQNLCLESTDKYPAGKELWDAHAAGKSNQHQSDVFLKPRPSEELFHLPSDPHQLLNEVANATHKGRLQHLREVLDRWTQETGDTIPQDPTPDRTGPRTNKDAVGEIPGAKAGANAILAPGPIRADGTAHRFR